MTTYKELIEKCHSNKKNDFNLYYYHRLISLPLTILCLKLKLKPNTISIAMILLSIMSFVFMINKSEAFFCIGVVIAFIAFLFDKIDGDLARFYQMDNIKGGVYDFVYHRLSLFLFYISIGIHFSYQNEYFIIISAFCGFLANYIEEIQLLSYRIYSHKYLLKNENIVRVYNSDEFKEPRYIKIMKIFRMQIFLFYYLIFGILLNIIIPSAIFYLICIAFVSMLCYSIIQLFNIMTRTFDNDIEKLIKQTEN